MEWKGEDEINANRTLRIKNKMNNTFFKIGTWNVREINGKENEFIDEFRSANIGVNRDKERTRRSKIR